MTDLARIGAYLAGANLEGAIGLPAELKETSS